MTRPLTEAQLAYSRSGTGNMRKTELRQKQQIASQRRYVYDGALVPRCLVCGRERENRKLLKCDDCAGLS